jgi:Uma2 family endonuclease
MTTSPLTLPMVVRADWVPGAEQGHWTYAKYAAIPDDGKRYEVINGVLYIAPSPNSAHQGSDVRFGSYLFNYVELGGLGRVFIAPFDVELAPKVTVQPDVVVVLNAHLSIITESHIVGAPDIVAEITSPGTVGYDRREKQDAYARAGVPEYWLADPRSKTIEILILKDGAYESAGVVEGESRLPSRLLPELPYHASQFFA